MGYSACSADLTALKHYWPWLREAGFTALQASLKDLDTVYQNFFRRVKSVSLSLKLNIEAGSLSKIRRSVQTSKCLARLYSIRTPGCRTDVKINPLSKTGAVTATDTSQLCSVCGCRNAATKDSAARERACPDGGTIHGRDHTAAKNILREGLRLTA
jgi:transposase